MKKNVLGTVAVMLVLFSGCLKDESEEQRAEAQQVLNDYINSMEEQGVDVNKTTEGLYYVVEDTGSGITPEIQDLIEITFTWGNLTGQGVNVRSSTFADTAQKYNFYDSTQFYGIYRYYFGNGFTTGFNIGVSMMQEGARYKLIAPSSLAFGGVSIGGIPAYSSLVYDVRLKKVVLSPAEYEKQLLLEYLNEHDIPVEDTTESGLYFIPLEEGTADSVKTGDMVNVQYTLSNVRENVLARTAKGDPFEFQLGFTNLIPGFKEAVSMMTLEQKAKVIIPWYEAYGESGYQTIPPYSTLIYELEIVSLE